MNAKQTGIAAVKNNHFTVVETVEAGRPVLTTVPHQWVQGSVLFWPPKKADVIRKDATSKPLSSWSKMNCRVKRKYIPSFEEAEFEMAELSGVTTDTEALDVAKKVRRKKNPKVALTKPTPPASKMNFNHYFTVEDNLTGSNPSHPLPPASVSADTSASTQQTTTVIEMAPIVLEGILPKPSDQSSLNSQAVMFSEQPSWQQLGSGSQISPLENIFTVGQEPLDYERLKHEIFQRIDDSKEEIKQHVSTFMETLLVKTIAAVRCDFDAKMELLFESKRMPDHQSSFKLDPVSTAEELFELEQNLQDKDYAQQVMTYMKQFTGNTGDAFNGQNVCYALVDKFFNRQFMTTCSWTGLSRSGEPKIGLKQCKNILNVYFAIVKRVNEHFSVKAMEDILKSVTRNAKKRSEFKNIRQSAIKRRGRNLPHSPIATLQVGNEQFIPLSPVERSAVAKNETLGEAMDQTIRTHSLIEYNMQGQFQQEEMSSECSDGDNENEEED